MIFNFVVNFFICQGFFISIQQFSENLIVFSVLILIQDYRVYGVYISLPCTVAVDIGSLIHWPQHVMVQDSLHFLAHSSISGSFRLICWMIVSYFVTKVFLVIHFQMIFFDDMLTVAMFVFDCILHNLMPLLYQSIKFISKT